MKTFNGKAIYNPSGKAREYSKWACNFYVGCSNGCEYCYCKKGVLAGTMGGDKPTLKKCFRDEGHAMEIFQKELEANIPELEKHGLFFSFTTDPMLSETIELTISALDICGNYGVPVKILTKCTDWVCDLLSWADDFESENGSQDWRNDYAFGFTITGHDELEPGASTNQERIHAMRKLHEAGFKTWASIEPIVDFESSLKMITQTVGFCDLYKVGLMSGVIYNRGELRVFMNMVMRQLSGVVKIYWKDGLLKAAGIARDQLPSNCIDRDYNIFQED